MSSNTFYDVVSQYDFNVVLNRARYLASNNNLMWTQAEDLIFSHSCNEYLSPNFRGNIDSLDAAILKWISTYFSDFNNRPSLRQSNMPGTVHDYMLDVVIKARMPHLSSENLVVIKDAHRLSMSAENIFGSILEEYISYKLLNYGWYCAWGAVVKSVDFVSSNGRLLQIKSRNNTENSSSNKVRNGTIIEKWWRFNASTGATNWPALNNIVGHEIFSEDDFSLFVYNLVNVNPASVAVEPSNIWLYN